MCSSLLTNFYIGDYSVMPWRLIMLFYYSNKNEQFCFYNCQFMCIFYFLRRQKWWFVIWWALKESHTLYMLEQRKYMKISKSEILFCYLFTFIKCFETVMIIWSNAYKKHNMQSILMEFDILCRRQYVRTSLNFYWSFVSIVYFGIC